MNNDNMPCTHTHFKDCVLERGRAKKSLHLLVQCPKGFNSKGEARPGTRNFIYHVVGRDQKLKLFYAAFSGASEGAGK